MSNRFRRIITHVRPHLDELLAIKLLWQYGGKKYPGIQDASIEYCGTGEDPEKKSWQQHFNEGTILVGVGGGPFDEHPAITGEARKDKESACSLVAKDLGLEKHPLWKQLVDWVTESDQTGVHPLHVANLMKDAYRVEDDYAVAMDLGFAMIDRKARVQQLFLEAQKYLRNLDGTDRHHKIVGRSDRDLDLVVDDSDNFQIGAAARSLKIAIVLQRQPSGNVQVFCNSDRYDFKMTYVITKIREAEIVAQGGSKNSARAIPFEELSRAGKIPQVPNWFYQIPGENLLNGSESTPDTKPTKIPFDKLIKIVHTNLFAESAVAA